MASSPIPSVAPLSLRESMSVAESFRAVLTVASTAHSSSLTHSLSTSADESSGDSTVISGFTIISFFRTSGSWKVTARVGLIALRLGVAGLRAEVLLGRYGGAESGTFGEEPPETLTRVIDSSMITFDFGLGRGAFRTPRRARFRAAKNI